MCSHAHRQFAQQPLGLGCRFVGAEDGLRVRRQISGSPGRLAQFTLDADYRAGRSANVVATIPGRSAETLVIGTPTNGWFTTAAERGAPLRRALRHE